MEQELKDLVWSRAGAICEYCRMPQRLDRLRFQIDHIIAQKHGGVASADNLALACFACNNHKGPNIAGVDPETGDVVGLFHPRTNHWTEHFEWRSAVLVGRTPKGRATIDVLRINMSHRVDLRESLMQEGVFPL